MPDELKLCKQENTQQLRQSDTIAALPR